MQRIMVAGDWHGDTRTALHTVQEAEADGIDLIVHVGDFGFWPTPDGWPFGRALSAELAGAGVELWFVDGNHENHDALNSLPIADTGRRPMLPHIEHLPRGYRWDVDGRTWLALGGAASVDRLWRTPGRSWWPDEYITDSDVRACGTEPVDVMVCHDAPWGSPRMQARYTAANGWPQHDIDLSNENRRRVETVLAATGARTLLHGHYHDRYTETYILDGQERTIVGLGHEASGDGNTIVVGPDGHPPLSADVRG